MFYLGQETAKIYHNGVEIGKAYRNGSLVFDNTLHAITQAVLSYATSQGYTAPTNLSAYDSHIRAIESVLSKLDAYYVFAADGASGFKMINVAKPGTYNGTGMGGLTWLTSGMQGNGVNAYLRTNFNPSLLSAGQKYQLNSACRGTVVYANPAANTLEATIDGGGSISNTLFADNTNGGKINQGAANASGNNDLTGTGLKAIVRTTASLTTMYNKSVTSTSTAASTVIGNASQIVLARDNAGVLAYSKLTLSSYFMGAALTGTDISTLRTATNTYLTALALAAVA